MYTQVILTLKKFIVFDKNTIKSTIAQEKTSLLRYNRPARNLLSRDFDNGRSRWWVSIVSRHAQTQFLCCFRSTMATDQNIKNKTLASEIDTANGRGIADGRYTYF